MRASPQTRRPAGIDAPVLTAAALLLVCVGLAAGLVWARGLGRTVQPEDWAISFRIPRGWVVEPVDSDDLGDTVVVREPYQADAGRRLLVHRHGNAAGLPPMRICELLLGQRLGLQRALFLRSPVAMELWPLGELPGARCVIIEPRGLYLHVGTAANRDEGPEAYVLELDSARPLDQHDLSLCEALARAVRPAEPSWGR